MYCVFDTQVYQKNHQTKKKTKICNKKKMTKENRHAILMPDKIDFK